MQQEVSLNEKIEDALYKISWSVNSGLKGKPDTIKEIEKIILREKWDLLLDIRLRIVDINININSLLEERISELTNQLNQL